MERKKISVCEVVYIGKMEKQGFGLELKIWVSKEGIAPVE